MNATKEQIIKNYWNFHKDLYLTFPLSISVPGKHIACHYITQDNMKNVWKILLGIFTSISVSDFMKPANPGFRKKGEFSWDVFGKAQLIK